MNWEFVAYIALAGWAVTGLAFWRERKELLENRASWVDAFNALEVKYLASLPQPVIPPSREAVRIAMKWMEEYEQGKVS